MRSSAKTMVRFPAVTLLLLAACCLQPGSSMRFWGGGGGGGGFGFGGGGGYPGFRMPPPGPAVLPPVNGSTRWGDILEATLQLALDHCKSARACNVTGLYSAYDSRCSECHPCSCDEACYRRGDCCLDKQLRDVVDEVVLETAPLPVPEQGCHSTYVTPYQVASHVFMVDSCPPGAAHTEDAARCLHPSSNDTASMWPVWSPDTDTVYRSVYCARCHGRHLADVLRWDLKLECEKSVRLPEPPDVDALLPSLRQEVGCQVSFSPPEGCAPFPCRPRAGDYIAACNVTGRRMAYDRGLWQACRVFRGEVTLDSTYSNVFCALCNDDEVNTVGQCPGVSQFPYFVVLNVSSMRQPSAVGRDNADNHGHPCSCRDDDIYDVYDDQCRELICSMTHTLKDRRCQPFITNATGLFYDVAISLTPSRSQRPVYVRNTSSLKQVARNIRTAFLLQGSTSMGWHVQTDHFRVIVELRKAGRQLGDADGKKNAGLEVLGFRVRIKFGTRWAEPADLLEARLLALTRSTWNVSVGGMPKRSFTAAPLYIGGEEPDDRVYPIVSLLSSHADVIEYVVDIPDQHIPGYDNPKLTTDFHLFVSESLLCPKVAFNVSDDANEEDHAALRVNRTSGSVYHIKSDKVIGFEFVELRDNDEVLVCADQLYGALEPAVQPAELPGKAFTTTLQKVSIACQSLSVLCLALVVFTYCFFSELRAEDSDRSTLGLAVALLLTLLLFAVGTSGVSSTATCTMLAVATHFCLLSAFTWVALCCWQSYRALASLGTTNPEAENGKNDKGGCVLAKYAAASVVLPTLLVTATFLGNLAAGLDDCSSGDLGYGGRGEACFLSNAWSLVLSAILPVSVAGLFSLALFFLSVRRRLASVSRQLHTSTPCPFRRFITCIRACVLMTVTWLVGISAALTDTHSLWYVFFVLSSLTGIFVFVAFVCNKKVFQLYQNSFSPSIRKGRRLDSDHRFTPIDT